MKKYRVKEGYIYAFESIFGEDVSLEFSEKSGAHTALKQLGCMHWAEAATPDDTISEYLNQLPHPYREKALANRRAFLEKYPPRFVDIKVFTVHHAIKQAFNWNETPEGKVYWEDLHEMYLKQNEVWFGE